MTTHIGNWAGASTSRNVLLGRLSRADQALLQPHVEQVSLARGQRLLPPAQPIGWLYFPEAGLLALEERVDGRGSIEVAVIGREGMIGWPGLLGCVDSPQGAIVRAQDGRATRIALAPLLAACRESGSLWQLLLGFVQEVMAQMARTIASHTEGSLEERIARWLLMRHDRVGGDQLLASHDEIADALNVRRASVTERLQLLEGDQLLRCRRGRIIVRDRVALERCAGRAYGVAEARSCCAIRSTAV